MFAPACGWGLETEANSLFNWTTGPESQALKYHLALCFKKISFIFLDLNEISVGT